MSIFIDELSVEYVNSVLQYGALVDEMINKLEQKGRELADKLNTLENLEGASEIKGDLAILLKCPMVPVLNKIKEANEELVGEAVLPDFYPEIVAEYIKMHPDDAAILHPLCIAHQHIRKTFAQRHGLDIQQVACRSDSTGKVVYSKKGLKAAGMSEKQAFQEIGDKACIFLCKKRNL